MKKGKIHLPVSWEEVGSADIVFDMDGTLIEGDLGESVFYWCLFKTWESGVCQDVAANPDEFNALPAYIQGKAAKRLIEYRRLIENNQLEQAYALVAAWIEQVPAEIVYEVTRSFLEHSRSPRAIEVRTNGSGEGEPIRLIYGGRLIEVMHELLDKLQHADARCWIVSASPQHVCAAVAEYLGVPEARVVGVQSKNGSVQIPWRNNKVRALRECGVQEPLIAFGDSEGDWDMLRFASHGVVIGDDNPAMLAEAQREGWTVIRSLKSERIRED
ncbi:MAG: haloacid dehalogenase-like hydrolase [Anaerolineales bacterium]|nr:haloacid dehalogenase-like hydrolase [Anaerolineales bacterium]